MHVPLHMQSLYDADAVHATLLVVMLEIQTLNVTVSNLTEIEAPIQNRDTEELHNLNKYCVDNAWFRVDLEDVHMTSSLQHVLLHHYMPLRMD